MPSTSVLKANLCQIKVYKRSKMLTLFIAKCCRHIWIKFDKNQTRAKICTACMQNWKDKYTYYIQQTIVALLLLFKVMLWICSACWQLRHRQFPENIFPSSFSLDLSAVWRLRILHSARTTNTKIILWGVSWLTSTAYRIFSLFLPLFLPFSLVLLKVQANLPSSSS